MLLIFRMVDSNADEGSVSENVTGSGMAVNGCTTTGSGGE
jgi:hypothetical protein